jgi:hypothetical protein
VFILHQDKRKPPKRILDRLNGYVNSVSDVEIPNPKIAGNRLQRERKDNFISFDWKTFLNRFFSEEAYVRSRILNTSLVIDARRELESKLDHTTGKRICAEECENYTRTHGWS